MLTEEQQAELVIVRRVMAALRTMEQAKCRITSRRLGVTENEMPPAVLDELIRCWKLLDARVLAYRSEFKWQRMNVPPTGKNEAP